GAIRNAHPRPDRAVAPAHARRAGDPRAAERHPIHGRDPPRPVSGAIDDLAVRLPPVLSHLLHPRRRIGRRSARSIDRRWRQPGQQALAGRPRLRSLVMRRRNALELAHFTQILGMRLHSGPWSIPWPARTATVTPAAEKYERSCFFGARIASPWPSNTS